MAKIGSRIDPAPRAHPRMFAIRRADEADIEAMFEIRASTRENAIPRARLEALGITVQSMTESLARDSYRLFVAECDGVAAGFSVAEAADGEVQALAVRAGYEGRGIGRALLAAAVEFLRGRGVARPFLYTSPRADWRAYHVYRDHGWRATGVVAPNGDERLEFDT
jgi:GNAT superfamily N-acetyltransferase